MSQFQEIIEEFDEELRCEPYGYLSEYGAFCNDRAPAYIFMHKYHEKYVVWICDEMTNGSGSDYIPECNIFDTKGEADSYFDSLVGEGIKDGEEQIEDRDCGHGFYDYDGAWDDDRVVTSFNDHFGVFSIFGDGGLWL